MVMRSIVPDKGVQSAWQLARRSDVRMPCVILVCPHVDGNVGSVSRCMLNWGLSELRIGEDLLRTLFSAISVSHEALSVKIVCG
jgi:hypothetical protein